MAKGSAGRKGKKRFFRPAEAGCRRPWQSTKGKAALLLLSGFSLLVLMAAIFGQQGLLKVRELEKEGASLAGRVAELQGETDRLRRNVQDMQTDPFLYEKLARERLGLVKPGEVVYDFRENPVASQ